VAAIGEDDAVDGADRRSLEQLEEYGPQRVAGSQALAGEDGVPAGLVVEERPQAANECALILRPEGRRDIGHGCTCSGKLCRAGLGSLRGRRNVFRDMIQAAFRGRPRRRGAGQRSTFERARM
jgi:hypothetical protein